MMRGRVRGKVVRSLPMIVAIATIVQTGPVLTAIGPGDQAASAKKYTVPELVKVVSAGVVFIGNIDRRGELAGFGSGFVVDATGIIVTNFHVIEGASALQVKMKDGEIYDRVDILDYDQRRDLAVLKVRAFKALPTVTLGDSSMVEIGEDAVAIGNPKGLEHTVSAGMISAFRQAEGFRLMQISVPISPGSSGGPLFDLRGRVIGITSSGIMEGAQNLNFAIPAEYVKPLVSSTATPMSVADFMKKVGASPASARRSGGGGGSQELLGVWSVVHDHEGSSFANFCVGRLYLTAEAVGYQTDSGQHAWEAPLTTVREAARNAVYGADKNAFHIRLITNTNYNFIAVDDRLRYLVPDPLILAIVAAAQKAK